MVMCFMSLVLSCDSHDQDYCGQKQAGLTDPACPFPPVNIPLGQQENGQFLASMARRKLRWTQLQNGNGNQFVAPNERGVIRNRSLRMRDRRIEIGASDC